VRKRSLLFSVLMAALALPQTGSAQATRLITGRVTDVAGARPLQGATITVEGSTQGTLTNEEGTFRLLVPARDVVVTARYIGYTRQTKTVAAGQSTVDFALQRDVLELESVLVTGQATTVERRSATTASAYVGGEELNRVAAPTFEDALNGKVSGVNIQSNSGAPGGGIQLQIRGNNTILASHDPLYVVDGVIYSNDKIASGRGSITAAAFSTAEDDAVNRVADINPADIESIEILKGAAASSIYGSKAANGVVIITTRRGQIGAPRVTLRQRLGQFRPLNNYESRRWTLQEAVDKYGSEVAHWFDDNPNPYFNHYEQVFKPGDLSYETALDVSGGTEGTRYFVGGTWKKDDGTELNTGFARQGLRVNLDQRVGNRANVQVSTVYNRAEHDRGWNNNCNNYACHGYAFAYTPSFVDLSRKDANGNYLNPDWGIEANSMQLTDLAENNEETNRFTGGVTVDYEAFSSERQQIRLVAGAGIDVFNQNNSLWTPRELFFERSQNQPGTAIEGDGRSRLYNWNLSGVHNYAPARGGWSLTTSAGLQYEDRQLEVSRITTTDLVPGQRNVDQGTTTTVTDDLNQERTIAFYAQEEVRMLNDLLLLQGGLRAERSSVNGDIDAFNIFPKLSASYRILGVLGEGSEIKPRVAYGETGNLPVFGQKFTLLGTPRLGGLSGFTVSGAAGNENVEPERVKEIEVGIDGIAWNERLTWELTGFVRNTTNLLLTRVPAPSSGFTSQVFNGGKLENRGIEAGLGVSVIDRQNVLWVSRATFTAYRNEVKSLAGLPPFRPPLSGFGGLGVTFVQVGEPMTQIVGRDFDGQGGRTPTDVQLGNSAPDYRLGFLNTVTYKRVDFSAVFDYQHGGDIINLTQFLYDDAETAKDFGSEAHTYRLEGYNNGVMTPYIEDATFLKLRELSVGVWLPERWLTQTNTGLRTARVSISGRNLFTWADYSGLDPEVANLGSTAIRNNLDVAPYPPSRSFFLEFTLGF
jgi:TonB-dependent starch-binding outer membrane protein SusC